MRSGFVSILGRPNAGKSTLVNALTGEKVAIVTSKPQTTRTRIHGIVDVPAKKGKHHAAQIIFVDTPGVHKPSTLLDKQMMQVVYDALESRDVVMVMIDASRRLQLTTDEERTDKTEQPLTPGDPVPEHIAADQSRNARRGREISEDAFVFELIRKLDCPVFLLINKIDLVPRDQLLPMITELSALHPFKEVLLLSARKRDGIDLLVEKLIQYLPEGERYFPKDQFTDQPERFLAAELIRERILMETGEEVPYASAVVIEQWEEPPAPKKSKKQPRPQPKPKPESNPKLKPGAKAETVAINSPDIPEAPPLEPRLPLTRIAAAIYCERDGQKAILIGKAGAKLKAIGASARKEIEQLLGTRVFLQLHIIVEPGWREKRGFLDTLDWRRQLNELALKRSRQSDPE